MSGQSDVFLGSVREDLDTACSSAQEQLVEQSRAWRLRTEVEHRQRGLGWEVPHVKPFMKVKRGGGP